MGSMQNHVYNNNIQFIKKNTALSLSLSLLLSLVSSSYTSNSIACLDEGYICLFTGALFVWTNLLKYRALYLCLDQHNYPILWFNKIENPRHLDVLNYFIISVFVCGLMWNVIISSFFVWICAQCFPEWT